MYAYLSKWLFSIIIFTSVGSQITDSVTIKRIRWVGATTAGHELVITESTAGNTGTQLFRSLAAGESYVEESSALEGTRLSKGLRIQALDSGQVWIYTEGR